MKVLTRHRAHARRLALSQQPGSSRWAACGPWPIHYRMMGDGPPILLLHGLGSSSRYWDALADSLARRYRLICPDLLGFGDSAKPYVTYSPALHCRAIDAVLADAGITDLFAVVGHSLGAVLTLTLLSDLAKLPAGVALITPPFPTGAGRMREEVRRLSPVNRLLLSCVPVTRLTHVGMQAVWPAVCRVRSPRSLFTPELLAEYGKYTYHSYISTLNRCLFEYDLRPALARLEPVPTLVLYGTRDGHVPAHHGPELASHLPNAQLASLPSRHHPALSHTGLLASRLHTWLAERNHRDHSPQRHRGHREEIHRA